MKAAEDKLQDALNELSRYKKAGIYIAHREDPVDTRLGDYLNTYPEREKLKILFIRESEGVY